MALAVVLALCGLFLHPGDDRPEPTPGEAQTVATTVPGPPPTSPAACSALACVQGLLVATISAVDQALATDDEGAVAAAVDRAFTRRPEFLEAMAELQAALPPAFQPDARATAAVAGACLDTLAEIQADAPPEQRAAVEKALVEFVADPTWRVSFRSPEDYLRWCPGS
jgi:hypothetical protein